MLATGGNCVQSSPFSEIHLLYICAHGSGKVNMKMKYLNLETESSKGYELKIKFEEFTNWRLVGIYQQNVWILSIRLYSYKQQRRQYRKMSQRNFAVIKLSRNYVQHK